MELRERLLQSADWCSEVHGAYQGSTEWSRLKHLEQDFRDAAAEIESWRAAEMSWSAQHRGLCQQIATLEEQLSMAKTEAKDVQSFRERENSEAQHIILGMKMAIQAMVSGMRGGK